MKKYLLKIGMLIIIYVVFVLIFGHKYSKANEVIPDGNYKIISSQNDKYVLDVTGCYTNDCANIELWKDNAGSNQKFSIKSDGNGYYTISAVHSKKYLDAERCGTTKGTNVIQFSYNGGNNQKWKIKSAGNGYYYIVSKSSGLYLDIEKGIIASGTNILLWEKNGGANQKFRLEEIGTEDIEDGYYQIASSVDENYVLDVTGESKDNHANIELWTSNNQNNQKYKIKRLENGYYEIVCGNSSKCLTVGNSYKENGANLEQYEFNNYNSQKWIIKSVGNGYYSIISKCNGLYLDICGGDLSKGTNIITWQSNGGNNQIFKLIPTILNSENNNDGRGDEFKKQHPEIKVGIDVSYFQGKIDWNAVKKDGIDYAMIRAGFRGYGSNGSLNEDTMFVENVKNARAAGLEVGVYFFSQATNWEEGVREAQYTIELIKKYDITYPVAFDTEASASPTNEGRADNISVQARTDATKGFCQTIEGAGYNTLIYASPYWLQTKLDLSQLSNYKIWLANYTGATQDDPLKRPPNYKGEYVMWQYTSEGSVDGIGGNVDCDIYYYLKND